MAHVTPREFRKTLRANPTPAEAVLWTELRNRQLGGYKFTRQMTIGPYKVDFVCRTSRFIVELDGPDHDNRRSYDNARTQWLNAQGYAVLRFGNEEVLLDRHKVLAGLLKALERRDAIMDNAIQ